MATTGPAVTLPQTLGFTLGQGLGPLMRCRVSYDDVSVATPNWVEVANIDQRACSSSRGREQEQSAFDAGTASVTFDNRDRAFDPTRANLIASNNATFDGSSVTWDGAASWFLNAGASSGLTGTPVFGKYAWLTICTGASVLQGTRLDGIPVVSGNTYTFSVYVYSNSGSTNMSIGLGSPTVGSATTAFTAPTAGAYTRVSVTLTATGTGNAQAAVYVNPAAVANFQIDGAQVELGSTATPFIEGIVRPFNQIWLYYEFNGLVDDIFKGYVSAWEIDWPGGGWSDATATATAADEFVVLTLGGMPTTSPPRSSYSELAQVDNPAGFWPLTEVPEISIQPAAEVEPNPTAVDPRITVIRPRPGTGGVGGGGVRIAD